MSYQWLVFDADDTLFDFQKTQSHALSAFFSRLDIPDTDDIRNVYREINVDLWSAVERQEMTTAELKVLRFERLFEAIGFNASALEASHLFHRCLVECSHLFPEVESTLFSLSKHFKMGIITNGIPEVKYPTLEDSSIHSYFEFMVVSEEVGVSKPSTEIFRHAETLMGQPERDGLLMIGDSLMSDIQGANQAGWHSCWFNIRSDINHSDIRPSFEISNFSDLTKLCE